MYRMLGLVALLSTVALTAPAAGAAAPGAPHARDAGSVTKQRFARCPGRQTDGTGCFDVYLGDIGLVRNELRFNLARTYCSALKAPATGGVWRYTVPLRIRKGRFDQVYTYRSSLGPGSEADPQYVKLRLRIKGDVTKRRMRFRLTSESVKTGPGFPDCADVRIAETHVLRRART